MKNTMLVVAGLIVGSFGTAAYYRGHPYWVNLDKGTFVTIRDSPVTAVGTNITANGSTYLVLQGFVEAGTSDSVQCGAITSDWPRSTTSNKNGLPQKLPQ